MDAKKIDSGTWKSLIILAVITALLPALLVFGNLWVFILALATQILVFVYAFFNPFQALFIYATLLLLSTLYSVAVIVRKYKRNSFE